MSVPETDAQGSPATTWKRLSVATVVEAHALVESFRAKGLLAASSVHK